MKLRRLLSLALALAGLWLVAFHAAIFWQRIADATILQSGVLGRWIASALLIGGLAAFRRRLSGRRARIVFWVLVAFLHLSIPAEERVLDLESPVATLVQVGLTTLPVILLAITLALARICSDQSSFPLLRSALARPKPQISAPCAPRAPPCA